MTLLKLKVLISKYNLNIVLIIYQLKVQIYGSTPVATAAAALLRC